jgi:hypothetical protein
MTVLVFELSAGRMSFKKSVKGGKSIILGLQIGAL